MVLLARDLQISPERESGHYEPGETAVWTLAWEGSNGPVPGVRYEITQGGLTVLREGEMEITNGAARLEHTWSEPGAVRVEAKWQDGERERTAVGGAVFAPEQIALSATRPEDFDAFWQAQLDALAKVPVNAVVDWQEDESANWHHGKITMDHIGGTRIHGQIARPEGEGPFPAMLIVQWAGVYGLEQAWVTDRAAEGWLVLNILPHDLPIDEPRSFYQDQAQGPLKDYWAIGNDSRETSYYLRMYLSCYRAAEYLATHRDWNNRTLVVMGGSQGGQQALVTAALHPKVTAALAIVPAGCDMLGPDVGRRGGWPQWYDNTDGKDPAAVREAGRYFDVANFAPRITCPVLVGIGLLDQVCPPEGIYAAVNQIGSLKELILLPEGAHQERNGSHRPYYDRCYGAWLPALRSGSAVPPN